MTLGLHPRRFNSLSNTRHKSITNLEKFKIPNMLDYYKENTRVRINPSLIMKYFLQKSYKL